MKDYEPLKQSVKFPCGASISNPIAMAPIAVNASNTDGTVSQLDIEYFKRYSKVAGLIITGAASVNKTGRDNKHQLGVFDDFQVEGLKKLAAAAQKDGNKAVLQLQHAGRGAQYAKDIYGTAVAPSAIDFPFLDFIPRKLTESEILQTIKNFGDATRRAIQAGFSGIEIQGANHRLLQQFFSKYSNRRKDKWGGSIQNRMLFPIAVVATITDVVKKENAKNFIVGYRISPEEIHGDNIGYKINESLELIKQIAKYDIDYIHISLSTKYNSGPANGEESYANIIRKKVADKIPVIAAGGVFTPDHALNCLSHSDIVAIGREALIEPNYATKIKEGRTESLYFSLQETYSKHLTQK